MTYFRALLFCSFAAIAAVLPVQSASIVQSSHPSSAAQPAFEVVSIIQDTAGDAEMPGAGAIGRMSMAFMPFREPVDILETDTVAAI